MIEKINVHPTKELFIYMLTRDVILEKAIIDLIDNSVDAAINNSVNNDLNPFTINIKLKEDLFEIYDNCGGIDLQVAKEYAFKFGRPSEIVKQVGNIGQFGIGLKRTIFKLGGKAFIDSKSLKSQFQLDLDIEDWKNDKDKWTFDLNVISEDSNNLEDTFTLIRIQSLHHSVSESFKLENFITKLKQEIKEAHAYNLAKGLKILINEESLTYDVPTLKSNEEINIFSQEYKFYSEEGEEKEVKVTIIAGLTYRDLTSAGWYIYCNNRLLVSANQNMLTGWGSNGERKFHHDFAFFKGYVFFESKDGDRLPWTTTKDGINFNSDVYQAILIKMQNEIKPLLDLLKDLGEETTLYNKDPDNIERKIYNSVNNLLDNGTTVNLSMLPKNQSLKIPNFKLTTPRKMGTITFSRPVDELKEIMAHLKVSKYKDVGIITYKYYMDNEME